MHPARQAPAVPQPASQPAPRTDCATDPAWRAEAATANAKLLQSRQRPAPSQNLRQPRRHYAAPASSDDARNAPADKDLRWLAQVTAPRDVLTASIPQTVQRDLHLPAPRGPRQPERNLAHPEPWDRWLNSMNRLATAKRHRRQCRVPRRQTERPRHKTGVVSRVPRSSRNAQAFGTDRNTYLTTTHQRQRTDTPGQLTDGRMRTGRTTNTRPEPRAEATVPA